MNTETVIECIFNDEEDEIICEGSDDESILEFIDETDGCNDIDFFEVMSPTIKNN